MIELTHRWGVFVWKQEGQYKKEDAIGKIYKRKKAAESYAALMNLSSPHTQDQFVVREVIF